MSEPIIDPAAQAERPLEDNGHERNLLDQLLVDSRLYKSSKEFKELLDFTIRLRNMAPFNAMLLQIQKPGLNYAASAHDWKHRFQRTVKEKSRPLLIMWPFGPVALVYDMLDTEGKELPKDAFAFYAAGKIDAKRIATFTEILKNQHIFIKPYDQGDNDAGFIRRLSTAPAKNTHSTYELGMNRNHTVAMSFVTLAHELGHLFLGHLGDDKKLQTQGRRPEYRIQEIEAESVAYIVSSRNGIESRSQKYLSDYIAGGETTEDLDLYAITRAAGHIERLLRLSKSTQWVEDESGGR
jgi:hypothetical protein